MNHALEDKYKKFGKGIVGIQEYFENYTINKFSFRKFMHDLISFKSV